MYALSDCNWAQSWEEGNTEDSENQMAPLGVVEESLCGSTEKSNLKTVREKMELRSISVTSADWQLNEILALNP